VVFYNRRRIPRRFFAETSLETIDHRELKTLAQSFLMRLGCVVVAPEVACPIARFRVDVAGWCELGEAPFARRDARVSRASLWSGSMREEAASTQGSTGTAGNTGVAARSEGGRSEHGMRAARTIIIECKQCRADFLRDDARLDELLRERERLRARKIDLEQTIVRRFEPQLRISASSLFSECEEWRFEQSRIATYRKVLVALRRVDESIHGQTKFCLLARYRLADRLYIAAPVGVISAREVPSGWGLLECRRGVLRRGGARVSELDDLPVNETVPAPPLGSPDHRRIRLLRNMAVAATRSMVAVSRAAGAPIASSAAPVERPSCEPTLPPEFRFRASARSASSPASEERTPHRLASAEDASATVEPG